MLRRTVVRSGNTSLGTVFPFVFNVITEISHGNSRRESIAAGFTTAPSRYPPYVLLSHIKIAVPRKNRENSRIDLKSAFLGVLREITCRGVYDIRARVSYDRAIRVPACDDNLAFNEQSQNEVT